jgi:hypothetical protein
MRLKGLTQPTLEGAGRTDALLARLSKQRLIFSVVAARPQDNSHLAVEAPLSTQGPCPKARAGVGQEIRPAHWRAERKGRIPLEE